VLGTPGAGGSRPTSGRNPAPAPSATHGATSAAGGSVPPPTAVSALTLAALGLTAGLLCMLHLPRPRPRRALFISLLERPG
jgi:hypothetical protein